MEFSHLARFQRTQWNFLILPAFNRLCGILQRNHRKMAMEWSFSYNSFVKLSFLTRFTIFNNTNNLTYRLTL